MIKLLLILFSFLLTFTPNPNLDNIQQNDTQIVFPGDIEIDDDMIDSDSNDEDNAETKEENSDNVIEEIPENNISNETNESIETDQNVNNENNIDDTNDNKTVTEDDVIIDNNKSEENDNVINDDIQDDESIFEDDSIVIENNEDVVDIENETSIPTDNKTIVNQDEQTDIQDPEPTYIVPNGPLHNLNIDNYTETEKEILLKILDGIKVIRESYNPISITFDISNYELDTRELYYKLSSFFYIYYGQQQSKDLVFDMVNRWVGGVKTVSIELRYNDIKEIEQRQENIIKQIDSLLSTVIVGTDEEIVMQIAKIVIDKIEYTYGYSDVIAALDGKSVCNGYALLFNMMCNRAGIVSDMCIGKVNTGEYHAWNRITLSDGSYRYFDTTWADTGNRNPKYLNSTKSLHYTPLINDYTDCWLKR